MGVEHLCLFMVSGLLLNLTPGPDVLFVVAQALRGGVRAGAVAALGIAAGCFVHIFAAAVGVSALIVTGLRLLMARAPRGPSSNAMSLVAASARPQGATALKHLFFQGFWTNALNPKVALFFLAFVPQFIAPGAASKPLAFLLLGLLFNANALWVNIGWALAAAWLAGRVTAVQRGLHWLERAAGLMFVGFGLKLAFSEPPAA